MSRVTYSEIYEKSVEKKNRMCCPKCEKEYSLKYADDEVLVCGACQYSIEAEELQSTWQDKLEDEMDFYYYEESDFDNE